MAQETSLIAFFTTYRSPVQIDIYSCPNPEESNPAKSEHDEIHMTDGASFNYNGQVIPPAALKAILKLSKFASKTKAKEADVDSGRVQGLVFVSERTDNLETLHIALRYEYGKVEVFNFADLIDADMFKGVRMEDSGSIAGDYLIYVSTKNAAKERRQPWTAVYKTNLKEGTTDRLTREGEAHLSPSVSPSGKKIAVASFEDKGGWKGEIEDLKTSIFVMNVEKPYNKKRVTSNGGWPTWGSDKVLFFHRKVGDKWAVFRADISNGQETDGIRVTPEGISAVTPAALDEERVAVATIREKSAFTDKNRKVEQYRHIEIFKSKDKHSTQLTQIVQPKADHFNPFVIKDNNNVVKRIGYHCCRRSSVKTYDSVPSDSYKLASPLTDVGVFRVPGAFPSFSADGTKLAFVDNEFKAVWVVKNGSPRPIRAYEMEGPDNVFSPVWNQSKDKDKDILYVCVGPSFDANKEVNIYAIKQASTRPQQAVPLTERGNNAFPSTNAEGTKLVFRSTREGGGPHKKNLYVMDAEAGQFGGVTQLTQGNCIDTHCQWSPSGDWIVFSSNRARPENAVKREGDPDSGHFAVFLVSADAPMSVPVRVITSGSDISDISGHVNHPCFSPNARSILVASDLAAVSVDPISLPLFLHSVRPYGDLFSVDIDPENIEKNEDLKNYKRITHSRYENSTGTWKKLSTQDLAAAWNQILKVQASYTPACPSLQANDGESFHMTGHLCIPKRCC